ncbi:MAG: outer membrane protein assembly factor BamB [Betaproteobacteria bacterium]|nr:outer membrane protein assembly factor BamB [Betaproteobacteria bacterium]MSQ88713.1 outer membrane protein assembly factor BamB [Betaproteobacteria bacterium]
MRTLFPAAAIVASSALLLLTACSSMPSLPSVNPLDWFGSKSAGAKPAELPVLTNAQGVKLLWSSSIGAAEGFFFSPVVMGDSVYAASRAGTVARLDFASGQAKWRVSVGKRISSGVGSDGTLVVVAADDGEVLALDAGSGVLKWRSRVSSEVLAQPKLSDGLVLVRSADSKIFAFGTEDGKRRWVYQRPAAALIVRSPVGLSTHLGLVYAGFSGGKLVAISLANGVARWEATVALPKGATELERVTDIVGDPSVQGREVCAAAYQGRVACYDVQNGNQLWSREMSTLTGVAFDARYAFVSDDKGAVHALDRSNGRSVWKQDRLAYRQLSLPLPLGTEVAMGDLQGYVHFVARESGAFLARIATDGSPVRAAPIKLPGGFLVQTQSGGLFALTLN